MSERTSGIICGMSGMGKTWLMEKYIIPAMQKMKPVLLLDLESEYEVPGAVIHAGMNGFINYMLEKKAITDHVHVIRWETDQDAFFLLHLIWGVRKPLCLIVEEAHILFTDPEIAKDVKPYIKNIVARGRKYGLDVLLCTQRPFDIPPYIRSQINFYTTFRQEEKGDLEYLKSRGSEVVETIGSLPPHHFYTLGQVPKHLAKLTPNKKTKI